MPNTPHSKYVAGKLPRLYICLSNLHLQRWGRTRRRREGLMNYLEPLPVWRGTSQHTLKPGSRGPGGKQILEYWVSVMSITWQWRPLKMVPGSQIGRWLDSSTQLSTTVLVPAESGPHFLSHLGLLSHTMAAAGVETMLSLGANVSLVMKLLRYWNLQGSADKSVWILSWLWWKVTMFVESKLLTVQS